MAINPTLAIYITLLVKLVDKSDGSSQEEGNGNEKLFRKKGCSHQESLGIQNHIADRASVHGVCGGVLAGGETGVWQPRSGTGPAGRGTGNRCHGEEAENQGQVIENWQRVQGPSHYYPALPPYCPSIAVTASSRLSKTKPRLIQAS